MVAATTRALVGRGRDLGQISEAIDKETGPAEMRFQPEGVGFRFFGLRIAKGTH